MLKNRPPQYVGSLFKRFQWRLDVLFAKVSNKIDDFNFFKKKWRIAEKALILNQNIKKWKNYRFITAFKAME